MPRKKTNEEFIAEAKAVHGDKYDYSKVEYIGAKNNVTIICKQCGREFTKQPYEHVVVKSGCIQCERKPIYGVGINDAPIGYNKKALKHWLGMIRRCYEDTHRYSPTYEDCTVCDEWLIFSNYAKWFDENYVDGFDIDKDLIKKNNRVYCPECCSFVPKEINYLILKSNKIRGNYPIGVRRHSANGKFCAKLKTFGKPNEWYGFLTPEAAFLFYKEKKEAHIKVVANIYKDVIDPRVYDYLMKYEVNIND